MGRGDNHTQATMPSVSTSYATSLVGLLLAIRMLPYLLISVGSLETECGRAGPQKDNDVTPWSSG